MIDLLLGAMLASISLVFLFHPVDLLKLTFCKGMMMKPIVRRLLLSSLFFLTTLSLGFSQATQVRVETAADGSGSVVSAQNLTAGSTITAYAISRDALGGFVANVAADSWSLANVTGGVVAGDLVASGDMKSATLTARVQGSAEISATSGALTQVNSGTITVTPGPATKVVFSQQPTNAQAGASISPAVTVQLRDQFDNNVNQSGVSVTVSLSSGTGSLSGTTSQSTNGSGVATFSNLSINLTGAKQLAASSTALTGATSTSFTISPAAASRLRIQTQPSATATAGVVFAQQPVVRVEDAFGNLITSDNSTSITATRTAGSGVLQGTTTATAAGGVATFTNLAHNVATTITVRFTSVPVLTPDTSSSIVVNPSTATKLAFVQQPTNTTAGASISPSVTVQLQDAFNNSVLQGGVSIIMSLNSGTGTLSGTTTRVTSAAGLATFNDLSINTVGAKVLAASSSGLTGATSTSFSVTAGAAARLRIFTQPSATATAGVVFSQQPVVRVEDASGNLISTDNSTVVTAARLNGTGTLQGTVSATVSGGVATFTNLAHNIANTITLRFTSVPVLAPDSSSNIVVNAAPATKVVFVQQPTNAVSNANISPPVTVQLQDAFNNNVPQSGVNIAMGLGSGTGTLSGSSPQATNASGLSTFSDLRINLVGAKTLTASSSGLTGATSASFNITTGPAATIAASAGTPQSAAINTAFATALQATVTDAAGNPVSGVTVTFTAPASGASGTFPGGLTSTTASTNASGVATAGTFTANSFAGSYNVQATVSGVGTPAQFALTNNAGAAASISATAGTPQSATVNSSFSSNLQVLVRDAGNNPVSGVTVTFTPPASGASGTFAGGVNTAVTNASGVATAPVFTANSTAGQYTVAATVVGVGTPANFTLTNLAGVPASVSATAGTPQSTQVNTAFSTGFQVTVRDSFNNVVPGVSVTFTAPITGARGTFPGGLSSTNATTNASGIATASTFTAGTVAGTYAVSATVGGVSSPATFSLTNTAGAPASITATAGATQSANINTAFATTMTATVRDAFDNPVNGATVTFTAPTSGASGTFPGGLASVNATTNASGIASAPAFTANSTAGAYAVNASVSGVGTPAQYSLTNTPGAPASVTATAGTPQSAQVNTAFSTNLQVTVRDAGNNPVSGVSVTFTAPTTGARGTFAGGASTFNTTTNGSGIATAGTFTANTIAGGYSVTASVAGVTTPATFTLTNTAGAASSISVLAGNGQTTTVNTAFATNLQAIVVDAFSNPVSGVNVTFTPPITGASGTFAGGANTAVTNASGIATAAVFTANATAGAYIVTATAAGVAAGANYNLTNSPGAPASVTATAGTPQATQVNTAFSNNLQVTVRDASNNVIPGVTVTFTAPTTGPRGTFTGNLSTVNATTNASGVATAPAFTANTAAGSYSVTAAVSGVATPATFSLTNNPGAPASVVATAGTPQSTQISTAFATNLQVIVRDAFSNPVPGVTVTFTPPSSGASGTFAGGNTAVTNAGGIATANVFVANFVAGTYQLPATVSGVGTPALFTLTNTPSAPAQVTVVEGSGQSAQVGTSFGTRFKVIVRDGANNAVPGVSVTFTAPTTGATGNFSGSNTSAATTDSTGTATAPVFTANTTTGSYNVNATVSGVSNPAVFSLTNTSGPPGSITVVAGTPQSTTVNTAFSTNLQAIVRDASNNPISGITVTFSVPSTGASGAFAGGVNTAVTNASGVATAPVFTANSVAGSYQVSASAPGVSTPAVYNLTNNPGTAAVISAVGGNSQSAQVGTAFAANLRARVSDASNNPIRNVTVTFNVPGSGASGTFAGGVNTAVTDSLGIATAPAFTANLVAGSYNVTASAAGIGTPATFNLTNTSGAAATIVASGGVTQSATINTAFSVNFQATVRDAQNNPVSGAIVTFAAPISGSSGRFPGDSVSVSRTTNASGIATAPTFTAGSLAGSFQVNASVSGVGTPAQYNLTVNPGAPSAVSATAGTPQSAQISTAFSTSLQATVRDAASNPIPNVNVTFTAPSTGASGTFVSGSTTFSTTTNASGVAIASTFTANTTAGSYAVNASVAGVSTPAGFALTNTSAAPATITTTQGTPQSTVVNTTFASSLQVVVRDASNNPVGGVIVTFTAPSSGASGRFGTQRSVNVTTNGSGVATAPTFTADTLAGSYVVTAAVAGVTTPASFSLTNTAAVAATISATAGTPQSAQVNTAYATNLRVTVLDVFGNPVPGVSVTFTAPSSGASGTFAGGSGIFTGQTGSNGVLTASVFTANTTAGQFVVSASVAGVSSPATFSLTNSPGGASTASVIDGNPQSTVVGTQFVTRLVLVIRDAFNNPVPGVNVTFTGPSSGAGASLNPNPVITNSQGIVQVTATANSIAGGPYQITATALGVSTPAVFNLTNLPGSPKLLAITAGSPQSAQVGTAFTTQFQVSVRDTFSNPIQNVQVTFTAPTSGPTGTFSGGLSTVQVQTNAAGLATAPTFTANLSPGQYVVSTTVSGITPGVSFSLTNLTGPPGNISATQGTPQSTLVGSAFATRFGATVRDAVNNPVANVTVTFTAPQSGASGRFGTTRQVEVLTNSSGVAEAPQFVADTIAGGFTVTASAPGVTSPAVYSVTNLPRAAHSISATSGTPQSAQVSTAFAAPLQATVRDTFGNPVAGVRVRFIPPTSGASGTFAGGVDTALTGSNGVAISSVFVANIIAGTYNVTASAQGVNQPAQFQLTNIAGQPGSIAVTAGNGQTAQINTTFGARFGVLVRDATNNPVPGVEVTFVPPTSGPGGSFSSGQNRATTNANGVATAEPFTANAIAGNYVVTASAPGVSTPAQFNLTNVASAPSSVVATAGTPQSTQVNTQFGTRFQVLVRDGANNPVNGVTVTFSIPTSGPGGSFANNDSTAQSNSSGVATAEVFTANGIAGSYIVIARVEGVSVPAQFQLTNTTGSPGNISVAGGANQSVQVTAVFDSMLSARVLDGSGNPVRNVLVRFVAPSSGASGTFANTTSRDSSLTDSLGIATSSQFAANTVAGTYDITASTDGVSQIALFRMTNRPAALNRFTVEASQGGNIGLQLATIPFTVRISARDQFSNVVNTFTGTVNVSSSGVLSAGGGTTPAFSGGVLNRQIVIRKAGSNITISTQRTGGTEGGTSNAFNVNNPVPTLSSITPLTANLLESLTLTVRGTNFIDTVTTISIGSGITVNSLVVDSSTQLRANITIAAGAALGSRNVVISNSPPGGGTSTGLPFNVALPTPTSPILLGPTNAAANLSTTVLLGWGSSPLAIAYHLQLSKSSTFATFVVNDSTLTDTAVTYSPPTIENGTTYYWRVRARNATGASSFSSPKTFSTIPAYPNSFTLNSVIPFANKESQGDYLPTEYKLVGIPGASNNRISILLTGVQNVDWVAYWDNGGPASFFVPFDGSNTFNFSLGRAFWMLRKGPINVSTVVPTAPLDESTKSVAIPLHSGWNLITNPYTSMVPWSEVQRLNGGNISPIFRYEGSFSTSSTLEAYRGYYFFNDPGSPLTTLRIPFGSFTTPSIFPSSAVGSNEWTMRISLTADGMSDEGAFLGVAEDASRGLDSYEFRKPRAIGPVPGVHFHRPDWDPDYSSFMNDIRPADEELNTWRLTVQAPVQKVAEIHLSGIAGIPAGQDVYLIDEKMARFVNLREVNSYRFTPAFEQSQFVIAVGNPERVRETLSSVLPREFALGQNFPNPFNPSTTIPLALPQASDVTLKIYNILGAEVATLHSGPLAAGRHYVVWDGKDKSGNNVSTGMYLVRFITGTGKAFTGKMLMMK